MDAIAAGLEGAALAPVDFADLPGWDADDHSQAFAAFRRSALAASARRYRTGSIGVQAEAFEPAFAEARNVPALAASAARRFFERHFRPAFVRPNGRERGFVTGYYEPIVPASPLRTERFRVPLLSRPQDLVAIDDANRPHGLDPYLAFGRRTADGGIVEYHDRAAIDQGVIEGQGLEIAWLQSRVDAYFIHVQGAARLVFAGGRERRVTYAAKSGHRFTGAGSVLIELGELPREAVTMQSIRRWLAAHPDGIDEVLWRNRSYIFFREAPVDDPALGPVAAAKVPLTPGRSIAVDRMLHTFSTPFFIHAPACVFEGRPFRRTMIAQDTGSAIVGPARADLFIGSGDEAGEIAGVTRHEADFYVLLPRETVR